MRNWYFLVFILLISSRAFSQIETLSDAELGFSGEVAVPAKELAASNKTGFGGSAKFAYNFTDKNFALTFQSGIIVFNGKQPDSLNSMPNLLKETYPIYNMVPVKLGARVTFGPGIYAEPQIGTTFVFTSGHFGESVFYAAFTYAFNVGYHTLPGLDIGIRYESISAAPNLSFIGLRCGYTFTFRRQDIY